MKIRITGLPEQVRAMSSLISQDFDVNYISEEYPQNRKCKTSKYVAIYLDVKDFEKECFYKFLKITNERNFL